MKNNTLSSSKEVNQNNGSFVILKGENNKIGCIYVSNKRGKLDKFLTDFLR